MNFVISLTYVLEILIHPNANFVICYTPSHQHPHIWKTPCASNLHRKKLSTTSTLHTKRTVHTDTTLATIKRTKYKTSIQAQLPRCLSFCLETTYSNCGYKEVTKIYSSLNIKTNATSILQMKNCPEYQGYSQTHSGRCQKRFDRKYKAGAKE
jgi:hypothetical protein